MNKITRGLAGMLVAGASIFGLTKKADAGIISVYNNTVTSGVGISQLKVKNLDGATDGYDSTYDVDFLSSPQTNALEIYTKVEGQKLKTDARSICTSGWDFDLAVKGSVSGINNYLSYKITDTTDLVGKTIAMWDIANPSTTYPLLMDGAYHNINLLNLTASNEEYAHWRLTLAPIGDANLDGIVDAADYITTKNNFGRNPATWEQGDFSGDGKVDYADLQMLIGNFGTRSVSSPAQTPEPATLGILALGGLAGLIRKKR